MKSHSKTRTRDILTVLHILAWVAFVGFCIEAGTVLVSYGVSCVNPEGAKNVFMAKNLEHLMDLGFWYYTNAMSFVFAILAMKAYVWQLVIKALSKINLVNPFTVEGARILERISYTLFGVWIVGTLSSGYSEWLMKAKGDSYATGVSGEFIFMAGLVFIISQVFKRGVEIQSENELTV